MPRSNTQWWVGLATGVMLGAGIVVAANSARAQQVNCHYVPNGSNNTIACDNGFWRTITPDGEEFTGMGASDPSAGAQGSGIVINPATGGIDITHGQTVTPPTQVLPQLAPYQAQQYGFTPRQD
jgi:hypothetical protein